MSRSYSCKLVQHNYVKANGKANILLQIIINRTKVPIKTGIEVQPYLFNRNTGKIIAGGNNQKLILFSRGKAISGAPIIKGTNQFPKPPIKIGITMKKIIMKACPVIKTFHN